MLHSYRKLWIVALSSEEPVRSMATIELSLFSIEILGLVGHEGAGAARPAADGAARPDARLGRREPVLHRAQAPREARLPQGAQGARQDPRAHRLHAHRQGTRRAARVRAQPRHLHTAQERRTPAPAHLRPRRRTGHAREHDHACATTSPTSPRDSKTPSAARRTSRTARSTCGSSPDSCAASSSCTTSSSTTSSASSPQKPSPGPGNPPDASAA